MAASPRRSCARRGNTTAPPESQPATAETVFTPRTFTGTVRQLGQRKSSNRHGHRVRHHELRQPSGRPRLTTPRMARRRWEIRQGQDADLGAEIVGVACRAPALRRQRNLDAGSIFAYRSSGDRRSGQDDCAEAIAAHSCTELGQYSASRLYGTPRAEHVERGRAAGIRACLDSAGCAPSTVVLAGSCLPVMLSALEARHSGPGGTRDQAALIEGSGHSATQDRSALRLVS